MDYNTLNSQLEKEKEAVLSLINKFEGDGYIEKFLKLDPFNISYYGSHREYDLLKALINYTDKIKDTEQQQQKVSTSSSSPRRSSKRKSSPQTQSQIQVSRTSVEKSPLNQKMSDTYFDLGPNPSSPHEYMDVLGTEALQV